MIDRVAGETGIRHPGCQNLEVILLWLHSPSVSCVCYLIVSSRESVQWATVIAHLDEK